MYKSISDFGAPQQPERFTDQYDVVEIQNAQHKTQVLAANKIVCIDIYADWCGPCKQTAPTYALLAAKYTKQGHCAVVKYRFENMPANERQQIGGIPLFEFYLSGRKIADVVGADLQAVENTLAKIISDDNNNPIIDLRSSQGPQYNRSTIRSGKSASLPEEPVMYVPPANGGQQPQYFNSGATPPPRTGNQAPNPYAQFSYSQSVDNDMYKS
jgi:thioredoxin 1